MWSSSRLSPSTPTAWGSVVAPEAAVPTEVPGGRFSELDGQRAVAVLGVVVFHVYQFCNVANILYRGTPAYPVLNSLDAMMPWLFVLSGFLLFAPIARDLVDGRRPTAADGFLARRAIKLLPVYYVAVIAVWFLRQPSLPGDWRDLLEHLTFTQIFDEKRIFYTIGPAWAVSVAVFFYLTLALVTAGLDSVCGRLEAREQRVAALAGVCAGLVAVSVAWRVTAFAVGHRPASGSFTDWFGPLASFDSFAVGMAVAVLAAALGGRRPLSARGRYALRVSGVSIVVLAFATRGPQMWSAVAFPTVCSVGFGLLVVAAVLGPAGDGWGHLLSHPPLPWLGTIALSIYIWHEPVMLFLWGRLGLVRQSPGAFIQDSIVVIAVSILLGWLSYTVIERPSSRLRYMVGRRSSGAGSSGVRSSGVHRDVA